MKRTAAVLAFVMVAAAGCPKDSGGGSEQEARDAIPGAENVKINLPAAQGSAKPILGQVAPFYVITLGTAVTLNLSVGAFLTMVRVVVAFPVTSIEGDTWIWGPWHDNGKPGEYRLTVTMNEDRDYEWTLEGRKYGVAGDFQVLVAGIATPGHPRRGSGSFSMNFDLAKTIDPATDAEGEIHVTYDLEHEPVTLAIDAEKLAPAPGGGSAVTTFHYTYSEKKNGSGDLTFMSYGDLDDPGPAWEMANFHSRWQADGQGRADANISGGDLGTATVSATECWNSLFRRTYYGDSIDWLPDEGSPSACVF